MEINMDWNKVIPAPIPMKRARASKENHKDMHPEYTAGLKDEASKTSKLFREKIAQDLERAMKGKLCHH